MKKPIRQWLETIADPTIREAAISQIDENWEMWPKDGMARSLCQALLKFNDWEKTEKGSYYWDEVQNLACKDQLETREVEAPKMKEGYIPYSNEQERLWAIAQAERMGAKEWEENQAYKDKRDKYICVHQFGGYIWQDEYDYDPGRGTLIPLERPEEATKLEEQVYWSADSEAKGFMYNTEKFKLTEQEDGTIILKPKTPTYYVRIYQDYQGQVKTQIFNTPIQSDGSDKVVEFKPKND